MSVEGLEDFTTDQIIEELINRHTFAGVVVWYTSNVKQGEVELCWEHQWEGAEQDAEGVTSRVRNHRTGDIEELRSRTLIAADGAGSAIRKSLGIEMTGPDRLASFVHR